MAQDPNRNKLFHDVRDYKYINVTSKYKYMDLFCLGKPKFPVVILETVLMNMKGGGFEFPLIALPICFLLYFIC